MKRQRTTQRDPEFFRILLQKKNQSFFGQLIRSILTSNLSFGVDFLAYILLVEFIPIHYLYSVTISFTLGTSLLYFLSRWWVFRDRRIVDSRLEYSLFIAIGVVGLLLNALFLWIFVQFAELPHGWARIAAGSVVFFLNFLMRKYLLFSHIRILDFRMIVQRIGTVYDRFKQKENKGGGYA
ncbi:MAG: GtrA family protein [Spirochaetales bacterium]|nr:GtrA family protein [Spirochaetales bacterium]MCF7938130.1 GtrA family protein [Spirochaetales bacterium]